MEVGVQKEEASMCFHIQSGYFKSSAIKSGWSLINSAKLCKKGYTHGYKA